MTGIVRIKPQYDQLILIDAKNGLYLAEDGPFYGVIDENGNPKIYMEQDKIGVNLDDFKDDGLKKGYVFFDSLIPVQKNGKWYFYKIEKFKNSDGTLDVQCNLIQNDGYDSIGCKTKVARGTVSNVMVIEDYRIVIVEKNGLYGFLDQDGKEPFSIPFLDIYKETTSGQTNYYLVYQKNGNSYTDNAIEDLEKAGYKKIE